MQTLNNIPIITTNEFYSEGFSKLTENGAKVYHFPMINTTNLNSYFLFIQRRIMFPACKV